MVPTVRSVLADRPLGNEVTAMDTRTAQQIAAANIALLVDNALAQLSSRSLVSADEMRDLLLDIRLAATETDPGA